MRVDVHAAHHAPTVKHAIVQVTAAQEILLLIGAISRRHIPAGEIKHPLAGDFPAIVAAFFVVVHTLLLRPLQARADTPPRLTPGARRISLPPAPLKIVSEPSLPTGCRLGGRSWHDALPNRITGTPPTMVSTPMVD